MSQLVRHARLLGAQTRLSLLVAMQYRWDFVLDGVMSIFWTITALVPLYLVFQERPVIAGWTYGEALVVIGWFTLLDAILKGAINPSLTTVIEHIRKGTLDFVLLKPADAQFLVSTARFRPWNALGALAALAVFVYAFRELGTAPGALEVLTALVMLAAGLLVLYSLWILVVSVAFRAVRIDNLRYLFQAIFDAARWPASVFKGVVSFVFTFVIPLALMTTYPSRALLGTLRTEQLVGGVVGALLFAALARVVWLRSIRTYASASS
ncbi:MAG TPA: ABC-2 family transporter protein [Sandaracinaceae bacterium LLY-WYZ-13_1]|nr:ABC-2 family transporter protein [Sandaracinaceae bacterium LLY-WYZ-13_1]